MANSYRSFLGSEPRVRSLYAVASKAAVAVGIDDAVGARAGR